MKPGIDFIGVCTPFYCNNGKGKFLLHKRSINCRDEHGRWDTGSGRLGFYQTPEESVLREVREEYGCVGKIQRRLPPQSIIRVWEGQRTHWLAIPFFILVNPLEAKINEPDKIDEIGWFTINKLPKPLHTGLQQTMAKHKESFVEIARLTR